MAHRKGSQRTDYEERARVQRPRYTAKHTEQLAASRHHERQAGSEHGARVRSPRRKRTATGYIDRSDCPSYPYISTRNHSPASDYITRPTSYNDDYIQPREHQDRPGYFRPSQNVDHARWNVQAFASKEDFMRSHGLEDQRDGHFEGTKTVRRKDTQPKQYGSDVEDIPNHRDAYQYHTRSRSRNSEEGTDVVTEQRRSVGSDVASIHSGRSSYSRSDRRSIKSLAVGSDVQNVKGSSGSDSDSEGGYISLDDHIGGGSDCVSNRSLSEDEGEGSDAVGSEVSDGSDIADASDVEDFDDGEDCISGGSDDEDDDHARYGNHMPSKGADNLGPNQ